MNLFVRHVKPAAGGRKGSARPDDLGSPPVGDKVQGRRGDLVVGANPAGPSPLQEMDYFAQRLTAILGSPQARRFLEENE